MIIPFVATIAAFYTLIHLDILSSEKDKNVALKYISKSALLITLITDNPLTLIKCLLLFSICAVCKT